MLDLVTVAVFVGTLAALVAAYLAWGSMMRAAERVQTAADLRQTRPVGGLAGRYVGGSDKPGSN